MRPTGKMSIIASVEKMAKLFCTADFFGSAPDGKTQTLYQAHYCKIREYRMKEIIIPWATTESEPSHTPGGSIPVVSPFPRFPLAGEIIFNRLLKGAGSEYGTMFGLFRGETTQFLKDCLPIDFKRFLNAFSKSHLSHCIPRGKHGTAPFRIEFSLRDLAIVDSQGYLQTISANPTNSANPIRPWYSPQAPQTDRVFHRVLIVFSGF
jgi:hypothetical protein